MENRIKDSTISDTARLFSNIRLVDSVVKDGVCIGDDSDITSSILAEKSEIGRRNLIRNTRIGRGSYTGTNAIIKNADIGNYCCIGWNISIGGGNHNMNNVSMYTDYWYHRTFGVDFSQLIGSNETAERVIIGNDVWIGSHANILQGVHIGNGCVIGAGAVVTKDIEPYSVVVGVPAKVRKKRFSDEIIDLLNALQWWNWSEEQIVEKINFLRSTPDVDELKNLLRSVEQ